MAAWSTLEAAAACALLALPRDLGHGDSQAPRRATREMCSLEAAQRSVLEPAFDRGHMRELWPDCLIFGAGPNSSRSACAPTGTGDVADLGGHGPGKQISDPGDRLEQHHAELWVRRRRSDMSVKSSVRWCGRAAGAGL